MTVEPIKIVDPNQSNLRILAKISPFSRSTFKKNIMAMVPTPIRGRLTQKIHLQPEYELCANPLESQKKNGSWDMQDLPPPIRGPTTVPIAHMKPKKNEHGNG